MRLTKIFLVAVIIAGIVFNSFGQIFVVQKARAVSPPAPGSVSLSFQFTSSDITETSVTMKQGDTSVQYLFDDVGPITPDQINADDIPTTSDGTKATSFDQIYLQKLVNPSSAVCSAKTSLISSWSSPIYLIVWNPAGTGLWVVGNAYTTDLNNSNSYRKITPGDFTAADNSLCAGLNTSNPDLATMVKAISSGTWNGTKVFYTLNTSDKTAVCTDMSTKWESLKGDVRTLLTIAPQSGTYWKDNGTSALTGVVNLAALNLALGGTAGAKVGGLVGAGIGLIAGASLTAFETKWGGDTTSSVKWVLNDAGNQVMGTLYSDAQQLQKDIAQLNDGTNGGKWPCTDKMKIFKYDKALEDKPDAEVYLSLDAFSSAVNETVKNFEKIKGIIETPTVVGPDKESSCGGLGSAGTNIVGIMNSMGCGLAQLIHDAAAWGMTEARLLLTSFIGLKINFANVDTTTVSPANTGTAPATTPAATTPAGGTDTSTAVASATSNSPSEFRGVLTLSASDFSKANSLVNKPLDGNIFVWDSTTNGGSGNQQSYPEKIVFYEPDSTNKKIKVKVTCSDSAYLAKISKNSSPEIEVFDNETVITIVVTKANLTAKWSATGSPPNFSVKKIL